MKFSVVIPVLNERECLPATLESVRAAIPGAQIIAVDGGSNDGSKEWLSQQEDVTLLDSVRGKGPQLNAGARAALGEAIIFLHADSQLPTEAGKQMAAILGNPALGDPTFSGGAFQVRFAEQRPASLFILAWLMNARMRVLRRCFGDQALFVRKSAWENSGGYPDWPLFEDYEFVRRFKKFGKFGIVNSPVTISARRFIEKGVWRTVGLVMLLQAGYYLGISPATLKRWFVDIRPHLEKTSVSSSL
jgi:rSAM/selenodomain-associated transferase 2